MPTLNGDFNGTAGADINFAGLAGDGTTELSINDGSDNTLSSASTATGGRGGNVAADGFGYAQGYGGNGGAGVDLSGGSSLTNQGTITGGNGGNGLYAGDGGAGVLVGGGSTLFNAEGAEISGGSAGGGAGFFSQYGGVGGIGVDLTDGGTFRNAGIVSGGDAADSVHFGVGDSRLIIDPGAVFNGQVVATAGYNNVIELNAGVDPGTIGDIGTQYQNFLGVQIDAGANWTINGATDSAVSIDLGGADAAPSDILNIGATAGFEAEISNFDDNDTINLNNVAFNDISGSSFDESTGVVTFNLAGGGAITLDFANPETFDGLFFNFSDDGNGRTSITLGDSPCYCPGTLILTERGEVAVEQLVIGDRAVTISAALEPIKWIGRRSYAGRFLKGKQHLLPIRIHAGALGEQLPRRDLLLSPLHAMYLDGVLIPAGELVNGVTIVREHVEEVHYLHIELARHEVIWAEGAASETFVDDHSRGMFRNADEYAALYPDAARQPARYCAPRLTEGYEIEAIRRRLHKVPACA